MSDSCISLLTTSKELKMLAEAFVWSPYNKPSTLFEEYFNEQKRGLREVYLCILNGKIIGYATLVWDSPYPAFSKEKIPEIKDLNILVEHRRHGYGTSLIKHLEQRAYTKGHYVIGIGVGVTPDYDAARRLYPSLGYVPDGRGIHPDEWGGTTYFTKTF